MNADLALALVLAASLTLFAFVTAGGADLGPNSWAEIMLVVIGCGLAATTLLYSRPGPRWGGWTLLLFASLVALTAISISWSVAPDGSWLEANRMLSYLAAFGGAIALARLAGERWRGLLGALSVLATVISAYALLVKVFPATFDAQDPVGRLRAPFDYWNATGLMAALGLPPTVWVGARREGPRSLRVLAPPATSILITVVILSYSRSALLAAICGLALWFALVPLRLRGALTVAMGGAGAGVLAIWALRTHALTHDRIPLAARTSAGHSFGVLLVVVLLVLAAAGLAVGLVSDRAAPSARARRRVGIILVGLVALVPLAGIGALATSSRGLPGQVSHAWSTLTDPNRGVGDNPGRLVQLANSRPRYWSEGLKVGEHSPLHGVGAGGYGTARTRYTHDRLIVEHAHSYPIETFADLGAIGLGLNLALLVAWALACRRTLTRRPQSRRTRTRRSGLHRAAGIKPNADPDRDGPGAGTAPPVDEAERSGLLTLLCVVLAFGVHSTIDWTWSIPGVAVPALLCAGWLVGRGPLTQRVGHLKRRRLWAQPGLGAAIAAIMGLALLASWTIWQPLSAADADANAITALSAGNARAALADADAAAARDPLSIEPLWELSAILNAAGDQRGARTELVKAISRQPQNAFTWRELGLYDLRRGQPEEALGALARAHDLDLADPVTLQARRQAQAELQRRS